MRNHWMNGINAGDWKKAVEELAATLEAQFVPSQQDLIEQVETYFRDGMKSYGNITINGYPLRDGTTYGISVTFYSFVAQDFHHVVILKGKCKFTA